MIFKIQHDTSRKTEAVTFTTRAKRSPKSQPKFSNKRREGLIRYDVALLELETPVDFDTLNPNPKFLIKTLHNV